jgi:phosphatidylinositol-3-phosphatase
MHTLATAWRGLIAAIAVVLSGITPTHTPGAAGASGLPGPTSGPYPCGTAEDPPARYDHVVWVWMENHGYDSIVGSPQAPYLNRLISACGVATNYHNITHPSLPNYIAATSGLAYESLSQFHSDCSPSPSCSTGAPSIFDQVPSWAAYEETMPSNCLAHNAGRYAVRHNPPPYYTALAGCATHDVPYTQLAADLAGGTLPAFSFVTPDMCDDMHNCPVSVGDAWLRAELPRILRSAEYRAGGMAVFITWDEGAGEKPPRCEQDEQSPSCHVATIVISPSTVPGTTSGALFNHYSLLRTTEELLGIDVYLGKGADAASMRAAFNL